MDMTMALELTWEIVLLEMIHRVVVCAFETFCTYKGPMGEGCFARRIVVLEHLCLQCLSSG